MIKVHCTYGCRLADQGHTVIGVEVAQKAVVEFFEEQKVPFTSQPVPAVDGMLFQVLSCEKKKNPACNPNICPSLLMMNWACIFVCVLAYTCMVKNMHI